LAWQNISVDSLKRLPNFYSYIGPPYNEYTAIRNLGSLEQTEIEEEKKNIRNIHL
jgi:hypothetical protein